MVISERLHHSITTSSFHNNFIDVTPHPILARLKRAYQRVLGGVEMLGCVLILGGITASDVSAGQTKAQMNPSIAGLQALLATVGVRRNLMDLFQMCASCHRGSPSV
jgi:hypothetical protein